MIRGPIRSPLSSAIRGVFEPSQGGVPSLASIFGADLVTDFDYLVSRLWEKHLAGGTPIFYQDSGAATPATALQDSIGYIRDLSGNGLHLTQAISGNRPVISSRVNLHTQSDNFSSANWLKIGGTVTGQQFTENTALAGHFAYQSITLISGQAMRSRVRVKKSGRRYLGFVISGAAVATAVAMIDFDAGDIVPVSNLANLTAIVQDDGDGWFWLEVQFSVASSGSADINIRPFSSTDWNTGRTYTGDGVSGFFVDKIDTRMVAQTAFGFPAHQTVVSDTSYDSIGFPVGLVFNGSTASISTPSIDLSSSSAVTVFSSALKVSDAAIGTVYEFSSNPETTNGSFGVTAPHAIASASYGVRGRGTVLSSSSATGAAAPNLSVLTQVANIPTDILTLRRNGSVFASSATDMGSGSFGNSQLYVGSRNDSSNRLNGIIYTLPIIVKGARSAAEIDRIESVISDRIFF